jgi:hypothetical protein
MYLYINHSPFRVLQYVGAWTNQAVAGTARLGIHKPFSRLDKDFG